MREVAGGVFEVPVLRGFVNAYVVVADTVALIDAGLPGRASEILGALERLGRRVDELTTIAITHHHIDHTGALAAIQGRSGARVYTTPSEAAIVRGEQRAPRLVSRSLGWSFLLELAERAGPTQSQPTEVHREVADGERIEAAGLTTILTPGHTIGHCSYLHPASGTLFVGDAAALSMRKRLALPVGDHDEDPAATVASITKLASLDFETACFGHGGSITGNSRAQLRRFSEQLQAAPTAR